VPVLFQPESSRLDLRRLPETSRGRRRERVLRAVSRTALGRPPGTTTRMMSERPQWSAARRVPRSQGARGRLASVLKACLAHTPKCGLSHGRTSAFPALPSLFGGRKTRGATRCAKGSKNRPPGSAQRWLFDKVKNGYAVGWAERLLCAADVFRRGARSQRGLSLGSASGGAAGGERSVRQSRRLSPPYISAREMKESGADPCASGRKADPRDQRSVGWQRWLFDNVKNDLRRRVGKFACRSADGGQQRAREI